MSKMSGEIRRAVVASRAESAFVLRPSAQVSYDTLQHWLAEHSEIIFVAIYDRKYLAPLADALTPLTVDAVAPAPRPSMRTLGHVDTLRSVARLVNRYGTVIVLCTTDDEATTGYTAFRVLSEGLLSTRVILAGPTTAREWPGGRGAVTPERVRGIATLVAAMGIGLCTTVVMLTAVVLQDVLMRVKILR